MMQYAQQIFTRPGWTMKCGYFPASHISRSLSRRHLRPGQGLHRRSGRNLGLVELLRDAGGAGDRRLWCGKMALDLIPV